MVGVNLRPIMVQIANLALGLEFKDLLVEVTEVEGIDPESKPEDPAHSAIVSDATGHIRLVYRAATAIRPTQVKKSKTYLIAGVCMAATRTRPGCIHLMFSKLLK